MLNLSRDAARMRGEVARTYASASAPAHGIELAGYDEAQLASLPPGAAEEFFGCGNPLAFADVRGGDTVVDLGSGAGVDLILAAQAVGPSGRAIGVEMTGPMIARARKHLDRAGVTNAEVREGVVERLPIDDASVDWVISNCVVSLSPEKHRVFREIARVLKPGGRMLLSDIVVDEDLAFVLARLAPYMPSIGGARSEGHYLAAMAEAGLTDLKVRSRFVYEPEHLVGLFGSELGRDSALGACPATSLRSRAAKSYVGRRAVSGLARRLGGRVSSSKFYARRP